MKFGINAQVIIALLGALYILMVCREKYRIEYAEGEPVTEDERELPDMVAVKAKKTSVAKAPIVAVKAKKTSVAKAPIVAVKAEKNSIIEEEEEATVEGQAMIEEEGMSTGAIVGITAVSIVALIAIMITVRRLRR